MSYKTILGFNIYKECLIDVKQSKIKIFAFCYYLPQRFSYIQVIIYNHKYNPIFCVSILSHFTFKKTRNKQKIIAAEFIQILFKFKQDEIKV
jgi:hypothetical protein